MVKSFVVVLLLLLRKGDSDVSWSAVDLVPSSGIQDERCGYTEIRISVQVDGGIQPKDEVYLYLGGFTSGDCANGAGGNIDMGNILLWPRSQWEASWSEGSVENEFSDSYILLQAQGTVDTTMGYRHEIFIDSSSAIRPNCYVPVNSSDVRIAVNAANDTAAAYSRQVNRSDGVMASCYLTDTTLAFRPAVPKLMSNVDITFRSASALEAGDQIIIKLSGWTSGLANGIPGSDIPSLALQDQELLNGNTSAYFTGAWYEGCCYEQHLPGYSNSTILLQVRSGVTISAGTLNEIIVLNGQIRSQCGMPALYSEQSIRVLKAGNVPGSNLYNTTVSGNIPASAFESAAIVGDGCDSLNFCNGHGKCDYCLNRCECEFGYGAPSESQYRQLSDWTCEERSCPYGPAWATMPRPNESPHGVLSECSNAGICKRTTGKCTCFFGFDGPACERRSCPGSSNVELGVCSGHGSCSTISELATLSNALPLSRNENKSYDFTASESSPDTWDARRLTACVCDSSWPVGLDEGETDKPEWFGPDCSLRHCPSGDDPMTLRDETDCFNVTTNTILGGTALGRNGSKCHIDCSNRGICDYETGVCSCFSGFVGAACDEIDVLFVSSNSGKK